MQSELEKRSIVETLRSKHRRAGKSGKGLIIDELCERLSVCRKHAIRLLSGNGVGRPRKPGRRGRPSQYRSPEFISGLRLVWAKMRYPCGRVVKSGMVDWVAAIERRDPTRISAETKLLLLQISAATIDRILKPHRITRGPSLTRPGGFREHIPIQPCIWNERRPGFVEADTVAHCGTSLHGEFVNTLTVVDTATLRTETRAVFGRGSNAVFDALRDIESKLPFPVLGYDADNGGEVLNQHVLRYFNDERAALGRPTVQVTRSREYRKNDNAFVEQRNDAIARKYLGYERLDAQELVPIINHYYADIVCPLLNHFMPCFRVQDKIRVQSRTKRIYSAPLTPYARIIASNSVHWQLKQQLLNQHNSLDPIDLVDKERSTRKLIDTVAKKIRAGAPIPSNLPHYELFDSLLAIKKFSQNNGSNLRISCPLVLLPHVHPHNFR